jgi:hypothetical protein
MDFESIRPSSAEIRAFSGADRRRRHARHKLRVRVYVTLDQEEEGLIRDLSEFGLALQAVVVLRIHQHVRLRFELVNPRTRVEAVGQVVWTNHTGEAGIQLTQIGKRTQQQIKDWLLINVLATASYVSSGSGIFHRLQVPEHNTELIFSPNRRPAIQLADPQNSVPQKRGEQVVGEDSPHPRLEFSGWPLPISVTALSHMIDGLILLISALLFVEIFLAIAPQTPSRLQCLGLGLGAAVPLSALYWTMFRVFGSGTPGSCLAQSLRKLD